MRARASCFSQGLVDVFRVHVMLFGGLLLRSGHGVLDRVFDFVLPDYDEPGRELTGVAQDLRPWTCSAGPRSLSANVGLSGGLA